MKQAIIFLLLGCLMLPARAQNKSENMDRIDLCKQNYTALFGGEALTGEGTDPEFMAILQKFIFGEVFAVGDLDRPTRELITCTVLSVMQTLPQLKAHAAAALQVGVKPIELREAVYQCAPFIGFPKTLLRSPIFLWTEGRFCILPATAGFRCGHCPVWAGTRRRASCPESPHL